MPLGHTVQDPVSDSTGANCPAGHASQRDLARVTSELQTDMSRMWNSVEVHDLYESKGGNCLSRRNLVMKLSEHFGSDLLVLSGRGVANILVFQSKASNSLRLVYKQEDDEVEIALETISRSILHESKELATD